MTIDAAPASLSPAEAAVRRVKALLLYHTMLLAGLPATASTIRDWVSLGDILSVGAIELDLLGEEHASTANHRRSMARTAYRMAAETRRRIEAHRPGGVLVHAERAPRSWKPSGRVIDVHARQEVA